MTDKIIKEVVCTGGPCSGKSTFMELAEAYFSARGYRVLIDHESATDLITGGISPATMGMYEFQKYVMGLQLKKEELYRAAAKEMDADKILILYDRGLLDDKGYVSDDEFAELLSLLEVTEEECRDAYDLVLHMVTSAKGEDGSYTLENNPGRYESAEEACRVDDAIKESWKGHRNVIVIPNEEDFDAKIRKALEVVASFLNNEE